MDNLAPELLEQIFAHIPLVDLLTVHSLVCRKWRDIIRRKNFLPWKKAYFQYKIQSHLGKSEILDSIVERDKEIKLEAEKEKDETEAKAKEDDGPSTSKKSKLDDQEQDKIFDVYELQLSEVYEKLIDFLVTTHTNGQYENEHINYGLHLHSRKPKNEGKILQSTPRRGKIETDIPFLVSYICGQFEKISSEFQLIRNHPKFDWAKDWLNERMPEFNHLVHLAAMPILCCIAEDTWDIHQIFVELTKPSIEFTCPTESFTEVFYCIALALLHFSRRHAVPAKYHYQVFHAISFFENEFNVGADFLRSQKVPNGSTNVDSTKKPEFQLTAEQARIAHHKLSTTEQDIIKIIAFAGTGKTTSLIKMCEDNPDLTFLVVVYNKSIQEHAEEHFPQNAKIRTAHSLAWNAVGRYYNGGKDYINLKANDIINADLLEDMNYTIKQQRAGQVAQTINNFMNSNDPEIEIEHVPSRWTISKREVILQPYEREEALYYAIQAWEIIINPKTNKIRMPHDGYLKLWQLKNPILKNIPNCRHDVLMIDEGQDMNPAMLEIFNYQKTTKIIVGDPYQQIYMFRGAVNALGMVKANYTYHLTQSFRFGPQIGLVANTYLEKLLGTQRQTLVGGKKKDFIIARRKIFKNLKKYKPVAVIARTNFKLFNKIVKLICDPESPPSACFAGGIDYNSLEQIRNIFLLWDGERHRMTMYKNFRSFAAFKVFAENTGDIDFLGKIAIVEKHKREIPSLIEKIKVRCRADPKTADYVFTTTHKSKGMEWKTVILLHDFNTPYSADQEIEVRDEYGFWHKVVKEVKLSEDEKNLLYVALTRAKEYLAINFDLRELLWDSGETFEKVIKNSPTNTSCLKCDKDPSSYSNVLSLATSHKLWNPTKDLKNPTNSGNLCTLCSSEAFIEAARRYPLASKRKGPKEDITSNARKFLRYMVGTKADHYEESRTQNYTNIRLAQINRLNNPNHYQNCSHVSEDEDNSEDDDDNEDQVNNGAVADGFDGGLLNEDDGVDEIIGTMNTNEIRDNANAIPDDGMDEELGNIQLPDNDDDGDQVNNAAVVDGFDGDLLNENDGVNEVLRELTDENRDNANAIPDDGMNEELGNISDNFLDDSLEEELLRV